MLAPDEPPAAPADGRMDFEKGMRCLPRLTVLLIAANTAVFVTEILHGALTDKTSIIRAGALTREHVLDGQWWRVLSAMFLHGSPDHLIGNCIILYIVGMACEHAFGWARTWGIYFASGLAGALCSVLMNPGPSVGASGAIFGLTAAVICFLYKHQKHFYLRDKRIGLVLLIWTGYSIATGFMEPLIDNFDHLGGFIGGGLGALFFRPRVVTDARAFRPGVDS